VEADPSLRKYENLKDGKKYALNGGGLSLRRDVMTALIPKKMITMRL
jgi:hypothetical protein